MCMYMHILCCIVYYAFAILAIYWLFLLLQNVIVSADVGTKFINRSSYSYNEVYQELSNKVAQY